MNTDEFNDFDWESYEILVNKVISNSCYVSYREDSTGKIVEYLGRDSDENPYQKNYELIYKSDTHKVIYIPIFKNASTSIINSINFVEDNLYDSGANIKEKYLKEYKFFTVTRDPKSRWVSAMLEYLAAAINLNLYKQIKPELMSGKFIFDYHFAPQFYHLYSLLTSGVNIDIKLIKLDDNLSEKISNFIGDSITINQENLHTIDIIKVKFKEYFEKMLDIVISKNQNFFKVYEKDFYLYSISE